VLTMETAMDARAERESLKRVAEAMEAEVVALRERCPQSTWIGCLSLARAHLLREAGRGHLEIAGSPAEPD
jgi:hypothetical protein